MKNLSKTDKADRGSGGDVTKAEVVGDITVEKTKWDILNNHGAKEVGAE